MAPLPLRYAGLLALGALLPVAAFWLGRGEPIVALSAVSVLLIAASVYRLFGRPPALAG